MTKAIITTILQPVTAIASVPNRTTSGTTSPLRTPKFWTQVLLKQNLAETEKVMPILTMKEGQNLNLMNSLAVLYSWTNSTIPSFTTLNSPGATPTEPGTCRNPKSSSTWLWSKAPSEPKGKLANLNAS